MKYFLDTEFNGFGGKLISMALVPEDATLPSFYQELEICDQIEPWVQEHVMPVLFQSPVSYGKFQLLLAQYLFLASQDGDITIIADWPDDIRYFMEALIVGPGQRITTPTVMNFQLDLNIDYASQVPHNALHDARGIRDFYMNRGAND